MKRYDAYQKQCLEDIMDNLREENCPEDFLQETAHLMMTEKSDYGYRRQLSSAEPNPYWEPVEPDIDEELAENIQIAPPSYNIELGAFTCCHVG